MRSRLPFFVVASQASVPKRFDGDGSGDGAGSGAQTGATLEEVRALLKDEFMPQVNTGINNAIANLKKSDVPKVIDGVLAPIKDQLTTLQETISGLGQGGGSGDGKSGDMPPDVKAKFNEAIRTSENLKLRVDDLERQKQESDQKLERSERDQMLTSALSSFTFQDEVAAKSAFTLLRPDVKRLDDGTIIAGDNLPVIDYVKEVLPSRYGFLLRPKAAGGSGANGTPAVAGGGKQVMLEDIKPGMSPEERERAARAIVASL